MKTVLNFIFIAGLYFCGQAFGHDVPVHQAITVNAAASAYADSPAFSGFINVISTDFKLEVATNDIVNGSAREDDPVGLIPTDIGGYRSLNHFYDPLDTHYGKGLSDSPPDRRVIEGTNSFAWASISNCTGMGLSYYPNLWSDSHPTNTWSWQNARYFEWLGLTEANQSDRQSNLDNMFRTVGQVMHLLEDTSQPQHVRNEQHLDKFPQWRSPIEDYGKLHVLTLNYGDGSMLNWQAAGFTKLEDFWDRHLYAPGKASALNADVSGGTSTLGLAEWCNGNFLGARHLYAEYYPPTTNDIRYYPYPSRNHSTDYIQKSANLALGMQALTLRNGQQGQAIYLNKTGDGVTFPDVSRFTYFGAKFPRVGMMTINDNNVLSNYHDIFIPKAVKYCAGLLDYFFRGTMSANVIGYDTNSMQYTNLIVNTSGQDFYGGTFFVYHDTNGVRSLIASNNLSATLLNSNSLMMAFPGPVPSITNLLLVYQGTIGITNGNSAQDPVDAEIGIACTRVLPFEQTTNYDYLVLLSDLGLPNGSTIVSNLASGDFPFPLTAGHYEVKVNFALFDDKGTIGSS